MLHLPRASGLDAAYMVVRFAADEVVVSIATGSLTNFVRDDIYIWLRKTVPINRRADAVQCRSTGFRA